MKFNEPGRQKLGRTRDTDTALMKAYNPFRVGLRLTGATDMCFPENNSKIK